MTLSTQEAEEIALNCYEDPLLFNKLFLNEWFTLPPPWVHRGMLAVLSRKTDWLLKFGEEQWPLGTAVWDEKGLDKIIRYFVWRSDPEDAKSPVVPLFTVDRDSKGVPVAVHLKYSDYMWFIMPRGISKTTIVNADNLRNVCYHDNDFLVYLSETGPHAGNQLDTLKRQLESNEQIRAVFGDKVPSRSDPEHWGSHQIETTDGMVVVARGRGGQVRGLNIDGKRPSRIMLDDVEDKESIKTDDQREKTSDWFWGDVKPALPRIGDTRRGQLIGMATVLSGDCLALAVAKDPTFLTVWFGAKDPSGEMLWDHYMSAEGYDKEKASFARNGKRNIFRLEYDSNARPDDKEAKFKEEYIRYEPRQIEDTVARAIVVDPAISEKKGSDFCSFAVVGMTPKGIIHIYHVEMAVGLSPADQIDTYFRLHFQFSCNKHGVESVAYQKALVHLIKEEMFRRAKTWGPRAYFEIDEIMHGRVGKIERVEGILSPRYSAGYITHQRRFVDYESQLLDWPNGKKDGPDVVAMAVALLDPFAAYAFDHEGDDEDALAKDMFEPIEEWGSAP